MNRNLDNPEDNPGGFYSHKNNTSSDNSLAQNNALLDNNSNKNDNDTSMHKRAVPSNNPSTNASRPVDNMPLRNKTADQNGNNSSNNLINQQNKNNDQNKKNDKDKNDGNEKKENEKKDFDNNANKQKKLSPLNTGLSVAKKGVNAAKSSFNNVANSVTNDGNNGDEFSSNKQSEQDAKNVVSNIGKTVGNVAGKVGSGLLKLFLKLPLIGKIILIVAVVIILVLIVIMAYFGATYDSSLKITEATPEDVCDFNIGVSQTTKVSLYNYIKGIIFTNYRDENENFIEALTILISSNVYKDYTYEDVFDVQGYNQYNFKYSEAPSLPAECIDISEDTNVDVLKSCAKALSLDENSSFDVISDELKSQYGYIIYVKNAILKFYEDPTRSTISNVNLLKEYSKDETLDYTALLSKFEERDSIEIINVGQCSIAEDGSFISGDGSISDLKPFDGKIEAVRTTRPEYGNPYYRYTDDCTFQCPWYAKKRAIELLAANGGSSAAQNAINNTRGSGIDWNRNNVGLKGFNGDSSCTNVKAGSIISVRGSGSQWGHVAIIESVDMSTNRILISEGWNAYGASDCNVSSSIYNNLYTSAFGFRAQWWDINVLKTPGNYWYCYGITYLLEYNG